MLALADRMGNGRMPFDGVEPRARRGRVAHADGVAGEDCASRALQHDGWTILGRRVRTGAGEIDLIASRGAMVTFVEVKTRPTLAEAASAITPRQQARIAAAAEAWLAERPALAAGDVRFDVIAVDALRRVRRVADAFRLG